MYCKCIVCVMCVYCECTCVVLGVCCVNVFCYFRYYLRCSRHDLVVDNFLFCITISGLL